MSVTFAIESNHTGEWTAKCYENDVVYGPTSLDKIRNTIEVHKNFCEECAAYGMYPDGVVDAPREFDVNVSNMNARTLLIALGIDTSEGLWGHLPADDFLGCVLLAMASDRDDSGVKAAVIGGPALGQRGATMIDCGLEPGYFASRFGSFHALALEAKRLGRDVVWA